MLRSSPFLVLAFCASASAQLPLAVGKPMRSLKEVMVADLGDPKVQVALGITSSQLQIQNMSLSANAMKIAFAMLRSSVAEDGAAGVAASSLTFAVSPSGELFPLLTEVQLAKLRRLAVRHQPLNALGTGEMAYALELTATQKTKIESMRAAYWKACLAPSRPSIRTLTEAVAKLQKSIAKLEAESKDSGEGVTAQQIDAIQPLVMGLFDAFARSMRQSAREKGPAEPDPLRFLTAAQRRRFRELSRV